jgi:hypothetical protein
MFYAFSVDSFEFFWICKNGVAFHSISKLLFQIPQFLLDDCFKNGIPCRIFCTQPRRLAAIAVAERVAAERRERIGQTIGYQIRLESR